MDCPNCDKTMLGHEVAKVEDENGSRGGGTQFDCPECGTTAYQPEQVAPETKPRRTRAKTTEE